MDQGVSFNLFGFGRVRTAWVRGDDALLALDRNGNGVIDDGTELFGESMGLDGSKTRQGFAALSLIDEPRHGGNHNGQIDQGDALYEKLQLWRDVNQDGVSQPKELMMLAAAGIKTLSLEMSYALNQLDPFGNDLGLKGSFTRKDGSLGLMIDVFFTFSGERTQHLVADYIKRR